VRTPPICVLFSIFISQNALKRASMQIQIKHICTSESRLSSSDQKQFIDGSFSQDPNGWFGGRGGGMRGDDHTYRGDSSIDDHGRTIEEATLGPAFWMSGLSIRWLFEASGHHRQIQQAILLASHNHSQSNLQQW
jgi:hypothetical protein